jgi:hypothetical protein
MSVTRLVVRKNVQIVDVSYYEHGFRLINRIHRQGIAHVVRAHGVVEAAGLQSTA